MTVISMPANVQQRPWFIAQRWQEYEGESRANLLRFAAVGAFYIVELFRFYVLEKAGSDHLAFHRQATMIAVAWTMLATLVLLCLRLKIFPAGLKYVSTASDVALLTTLAALVNGPFSPLVAVYFLILALAALRFSVGLVWFATALSMAGYWALVGLADAKSGRWFDEHHVVPVVTQLVTLLTLAFTGVVLGQAVRQVRRLAGDYAGRAARES